MLVAGLSAQAQTLVHGFQAPLPTDMNQVQEQLKTFDPAAVAAARHYYQSPSVKGDLITMVKGLTPAIVESVEKQKGKTLEPAERQKVDAAVEKATQANFDLLIGLNTIAALETLSKDELIALDQFYTSPAGQSIVAKMPQLNQRLPGIFQVFMPKFSDSVEAEVKAVGLGPN
jgi:hypothetical protein